MGVTLHLGLADDFPSGTEHDAKSFFSEIISTVYPDYFNHDNFLTKEEQNLLYPDYGEFDDSLEHYRNIDPKRLGNVFGKVLKHLKSHNAEYPLVHMIYENENKQLGSGTSNDFQYKGYKCYLDGYHNDNNHREEIRVCRFDNGWETLEWINADPKIAMGDFTFYIETENKYEQYQAILEELIDICDQAICVDKKLLWIYSN